MKKNIFLLFCLAIVILPACSSYKKGGSDSVVSHERILKISTESDLTDIIEKNSYLILDFYSKTCPPCRFMKKVIDEMMDDYPDLKVVMVDIYDKEAEGLVRKYEVSGAPYLIYIRNGEIVNSHYGKVSKGQYKNYIDELIGKQE